MCSLQHPPCPLPRAAHTCPLLPHSAYSPNLHLVLLDGQTACGQTVARGLRGRTLQYQGAERRLLVQPAEVASLQQHMPSLKQEAQERLMRAPMAGNLVKVHVKHGDKVGGGAGCGRGSRAKHRS